MKKRISCAALLAVCLIGFAAETAVTCNFWDAKDIDWGDGRIYQKPVTKTSPKPQGYICDYTVKIPETGWYELLFNSKFIRNIDFLVDDKPVFFDRYCGLCEGKTYAKNGNVWLTAGTHKIQIRRIGRPAFPQAEFEFFKLRKSDPANAEQNFAVSKGIIDVIRINENLEVKLTAGGTGRKTEYEFIAAPKKSRNAEKDGFVMGSVVFEPSSVPVSKSIFLPCAKVGVYELYAREKGGKIFAPGSFTFGEFHVVDVNDFNPGSGKKEVIHVIDCVKQTIDGKPIEPGCFGEANGPSRVVTTKAGTYRESHDCTAPLGMGLNPNGEYHKTAASGFAYEFSIPKADVPYEIEIEYPDDSRRSVAIFGCGGMGRGGGKGYETGFVFPISNTMKTLRFVAYPTSKSLMNGNMRLALISVPYMERAAASKITIRRFVDDMLPVTKVPAQGGRQYSLWWEEGRTWAELVGENKNIEVIVDRFARFARYHGATALSLPALSYQGVMCRSDHLTGYGREAFDLVRLMALTCERYGMEFLPEVFPTQAYWIRKFIPRNVKNSRDARFVNLYGAENASSANPVHPFVQNYWINGLGEIADKLRDCKSFTGMQLRADSWQYESCFMFSGMEQGYDDWTIAQFTKDTGIKVPGENNDPSSCMTRYLFLTSPKMLPKWKAWRCKVIHKYHKTMRDRIAGTRKDITLGTCGNFFIGSASSTKFKDKISDRALELGADPKMFSSTEGLYLAPYSRYGTGSKGETPNVLTTCVDLLRDPDNIAFGKGKYRLFGFYFSYQEFFKNIPQEKLGFKNKVKFSYCSSVNGSGRDFLAKFAGVLGEQDLMFARDGGDNDPFGDSEISKEWFNAFNRIPCVPFDDLKFAFDPVTVRSKNMKTAYKGQPAGFYFYIVNRESYPASIKLMFDKDQNFVELVSGKEIKTADKTLFFELKPYELLVFRGKVGASVKNAKITVPQDQIDQLKKQLVFAEQFMKEMKKIDPVKTFTAKEWNAFVNKVKFAEKEFSLGHYWRARTALQSGAVFQLYHLAGQVPAGMVALPYPEHVMFERSAQWYPDYKVFGAKVLASAVNGGLSESTEWNKDWTGDQVLSSKDGTLEFDLNVPGEGKYDIELGFAAGSKVPVSAAIDGVPLTGKMIADKTNNPESHVFFNVKMLGGKRRLTLKQNGKFGIYAMRLRPKFVPVPGRFWATVGPFRVTPYKGVGKEDSEAKMKRCFETQFVPVDKVNPKAKFDTLALDKQVSWKLPSMPPCDLSNDHIVHIISRVGSQVGRDTSYAAILIVSDRDRTAPVSIAGDWEVMAWLNGKRVRSDKVIPEPNLPDFGGWRYVPTGTLNLKKGENLLMIQVSNGTLGAGFAGYLADDPGITCKSVNLNQ